MFRSILVPLDGSFFGEQALSVACAIASRSDGQLHLAHVCTPFLPDIISIEGLPVIDENLQPLGREHEQIYLQRLSERIIAENELQPITALLDRLHTGAREQSISEALVDYADRARIDLIVMTTHGRGGLSRFWLGSVADELLRRSNVPILMLHPSEDETVSADRAEFRHILVPLDGSALAEQILEHAMALGRPTGARYTLLRTTPLTPPSLSMRVAATGIMDEVALAARHEAQTYLEEIAQRLRGCGMTVQTRICGADQPAVAILEEARQCGADLIALATHGYGGLTRLFVGSVADKVLRGADVPVLVYRPSETDESRWRQ